MNKGSSDRGGENTGKKQLNARNNLKISLHNSGE